MQVYSYDSETGVFLGSSEAHESPLEPGVFIPPAHATFLPPPEAIAGTAPVFRDGEWSLVADHRGTEYWLVEDNYVQSPVTIQEVGEELPDGALTTEPDPRPSFFHQWNGSDWEYVPTAEAVDIERDVRTAGGMTFNGTRFQTRPGDLDNIAGASTSALVAIMGGAEVGDYGWHPDSETFQWIAEDNSTVPMDAQTMVAFGQAAMSHKQAFIFAARAIKNIPDIPADFKEDSYWPST